MEWAGLRRRRWVLVARLATHPMDFDGDRRGDVLLYNQRTGMWFQARNTALGTFSYAAGFWDIGLTVLANPTPRPLPMSGPATETFVAFAADVGDPLGAGAERRFTRAVAAINTSMSSNRRLLQVGVTSNDRTYSLDFAVPSGRMILPGTYEAARRWPFQASATPGMDVRFEGSSCSTVSGATSFTRFSTRRTSASSDYTCPSRSTATMASLRWLASLRLSRYRPPCPHRRRIRCQPACGLSAIREMYIGLGRTWSYSEADMYFNVSNGVDSVQVIVRPESGPLPVWTLAIAAPRGQTLTTGVYLHAVRSAFRPEGLPGFELSGDGRGCNMLTATFVVHGIARDTSGARHFPSCDVRAAL